MKLSREVKKEIFHTVSDSLHICDDADLAHMWVCLLAETDIPNIEDPSEYAQNTVELLCSSIITQRNNKIKTIKKGRMIKNISLSRTYLPS